MELIFLPGLSTAQTLSETSGRGVGMDVVKTNIDRLGGKIEISSQAGKGTLFRIKLPLTLAIIPSLIIRENGERYAIPQANVVELVRIPAARVKDRIQPVGDADVLILRGTLIPLVRFSGILGTDGTYTEPQSGSVEIDRRDRISDRRATGIRAMAAENDTPAIHREERRSSESDRRYHAASDVNIVILAAGNMHYGLSVDELCNSEEIVVKPLGRHLKGLQEYAGATIMGDGEVALILDVAGIALKAGISAATGTTPLQEEAASSEIGVMLLLMYTRCGEPCALPLDIVQRVERISVNEVELHAGKRTMRYRETFLPLVELSDVTNCPHQLAKGELAVAVSSFGGREVGFLGMMPVSVSEIRGEPDETIHRGPGVSGSAVINGKTVLFINLQAIIKSVFPDWAGGRSGNEAVVDHNAPCILFAEDSDFFRKRITDFMTERGIRVITAVDGQEAWELLDAHSESVHAVITDIEMPRLGGIALARKIREDQRFGRLPIVSMSSLAGEEDCAKAKAAGINEYLVKFDRDQLGAILETLVRDVGLDGSAAMSENKLRQ